MHNVFVGLFAVTVGATQPAAPPSPPQAPRPLPQVACPPQGCNVGNSHVVHISSSADVRLDNGVLHYVTSQVLQNNGGDNAEVIWTLPLPPHSAFHNLTMSIYGEMIMGEIYSKQRARAIYNAIVATKKDPALVEWEKRNQLRTSIYPILPAETKYIDMRLQAVARQTGNVIRVDYFAGSNYARHLAPDVAAVTMTFSYPDSAHYGVPFSNTHLVSKETRANGMRTVSVTGKRTDATLFLPIVGRSPSGGSISVLPHAVAGEDGYALINIVAPDFPRKSVPKDIVIVLDASSSMAGLRFIHATEGVHAALTALGPDDRFRIVAFENSTRSHASGLVPVNAFSIARARQFLGRLRPVRGTNTVAALEEALASFDSASATGRNQKVILLTDGAPSRGEVRYDSILSRIQSRNATGRRGGGGGGGGAQISVHQIDWNSSPVSLLEDIAAVGRGSLHLTQPGASPVDFVVAELREEAQPVLANLSVSASNVELQHLDFAPLGVMLPGESRSVPVRYRGAGISTITVSATVDGNAVSWSERVQFPRSERANAFAARLWATEQVGASLDHVVRRCGRALPDSVISQLGTRFSIPTPMTSYLVLEPGVKIGANGEVMNAQDFAAKPVSTTAAALAAARSGEKALTLSGVVTTGLTDPATGRRAPFSIAEVSNEKLEVPPIGSPLRVLAGKVAGLSVRGGEMPGSDVVIQIRNPLSISGSTQPLIIVDGVIQLQDHPSLEARIHGRDLLDVLAENIQTIEVVRGAAAAALYGQRAANGVIIIETKRGSELPLSMPRARNYEPDIPAAAALRPSKRAVAETGQCIGTLR